MLYDDSRRLLDSRFLKKGEVIKSGESVAFDAHLVDIGEPHGKHLLEMDGNTQVDNVNVFERSGMLRGQQNHLKANKSFGKIACFLFFTLSCSLSMICVFIMFVESDLNFYHVMYWALMTISRFVSPVLTILIFCYFEV